MFSRKEVVGHGLINALLCVLEISPFAEVEEEKYNEILMLRLLQSIVMHLFILHFIVKLKHKNISYQYQTKYI